MGNNQPPYIGLMLDDVLEGIRRFASAYTGTLITETTLVDNINDDKKLKEVKFGEEFFYLRFFRKIN